MKVEAKINELTKDLNVRIEQYLTARIRPKPKWLPTCIWKALIRRLLIIELLN